MMTGLRIVRVWPQVFVPLLRQMYRDHPWLLDAPYEEHLGFILRNQYTYGEGFSREMRRRGYEAQECISNLVRLFCSWARDRSLPPPDRLSAPSDPWMENVLLGVLREQAPDIIYVQGLSAYRPGFWARVRAEVPSVRLILGYLGYTLSDGQADGIDHLFIGAPSLLDRNALPGMPRTLLYHAFDPEIAPLAAPEPGSPTEDFIFAGSCPGLGTEYRGRFLALSRLMFDQGLRCWPADNPRPETAVTAAAVRDRIADRLRALPPGLSPGRAVADLLDGTPEAAELTLGQIFPDHCAPPVFGLEMHRLLARSRLAFNLHTGIAAGMAGNMRMFEATGNGCCLLTEAASNIRDLFEPDVEVVTYASVDEALEKARYLLENEPARRAIAEAGRRRTLSSHTLAQRCDVIEDVIRQRLGR
ncbi:glycosyltransferase family protein [Azospirillum isscasi]|uniref:Glycosyltransferase n=1 Tax=Azospirillum isscasi TaxID=3053926 RepID=A0ABU0WN07_9PROT|nr:glycosyltransferase [Azospirillum isscasi]MDQ2104244.1 glycosyltransferase [Azospirillum isscasi]